MAVSDLGDLDGTSRHSNFRSAVKDPHVYALAFSYFCLICGLYSVTFWLPSMLKATGISLGAVGWFSCVPYLATLIAVPLLARRSDRLGERRFHSAIPACVGAMLLLLASLFPHSLFLTLVCMTVATLCMYTAYVVFWAIPTAYLKGTAAAGGLALINTIGLFGGFLSPTLIGWLHALTGSLRSGLIAMATILLTGGISILIVRFPAPFVAKHLMRDRQ